MKFVTALAASTALFTSFAHAQTATSKPAPNAAGMTAPMPPQGAATAARPPMPPGTPTAGAMPQQPMGSATRPPMPPGAMPPPPGAAKSGAGMATSTGR
jgi:hypothetical protein